MRSNAAPYLFGAMIRRSASDWFQPILQIGASGRSIEPLQPFKNGPAPFIARPEVSEPPKDDLCPPDAAPTGEKLVAKATAEAEGPTFL